MNARTLVGAAGILLVVALAASLVRPRPKVPAPMGDRRRFSQTDGEGLYEAACQGCHMAGGRGAVGAGAYPALANDERLAASPYVVFMVLRGRRAMPPLGALLSDAQVAAVATYVRTHFGNDYREEILPAQVAAIR